MRTPTYLMKAWHAQCAPSSWLLDPLDLAPAKDPVLEPEQSCHSSASRFREWADLQHVRTRVGTRVSRNAPTLNLPVACPTREELIVKPGEGYFTVAPIPMRPQAQAAT